MTNETLAVYQAHALRLRLGAKRGRDILKEALFFQRCALGLTNDTCD